MAGDIRASDLLDTKQYRIDSISPSTDRPGFKRIHFSKAAEAKANSRADNGWFDCDPEHAWVMAAGQFTRVDSGVPVSFSFSTVVSMSSDGIPIPKERRTTLSATRKDGRNSVGDVLVKYDLVSGSIPEKEFTLSAFGLPEPGGTIPETSSVRHLWLGGGALVCAGTAIALWWFARRRRVAR
jgi:hypothetical protein